MKWPLLNPPTRDVMKPSSLRQSGTYPKLIHYNKLPKGGHFAACEQPKFLSEEMRAGFRSLRK